MIKATPTPSRAEGLRPGIVLKRDDGIINATALCKAGGKRWGDFIANKGTIAFISELETRNQNSGSGEIVDSSNGNLHYGI
jgi:hypothetical protein